MESLDYLNYRFVEEDFSSSFIPDNSNTAGNKFQGEWSGAWQYTNTSYGSVTWANPSYCFIDAYGFSPAFKIYASSCYGADYKPYYSFIEQYRNAGNPCAISKNTYPSASDPYILGIEFCHTTAKFESFIFKVRSSAQTQMAKDIEILGSKDGINFITLTTYTNTEFTASGTFSVPIPTAKQDWYKAYRFKTTSSSKGSGYVMFGFITPVGKWKSYRLRNLPLFSSTNVNTSSQTDGSDISTPVLKNKATRYGACGDIFNKYRTNIKCKKPLKTYRSDGTIRKYYKKHTFSRPTLTADGTAGVSSFACFAYDAYSATYAAWKCFDGDKTSTYWRCTLGNGAYIGWYYEHPLNVTGFTWTNYSTAPKYYRVQASHNGEEWRDIYVGTNTNTTSKSSWTASFTNSNYYKYYRIFVDTTSSGVTYCMDLAITGTYLVESTSSSYDVYIDSNDYLLDWQIEDGSFTFTSYGTQSFTVPRGVKNITVTYGDYSGTYQSSQYQYITNIESGDIWGQKYRRDVGTETVDWEDSSVSHVIEVSSGRTYWINITSSGMSSYPTISWGKSLNEQKATLVSHWGSSIK